MFCEPFNEEPTLDSTKKSAMNLQKGKEKMMEGREKKRAEFG